MRMPSDGNWGWGHGSPFPTASDIFEFVLIKHYLLFFKIKQIIVT